MNSDKMSENTPMPPKEDQVTTTPEEDQATTTPEEDQAGMPPKEDQVAITPGGDGVATPPEENQINESYWPVLRKILEEDPSGMDRMNLECMVCKSPMSTKANEHVKGDNGADHRATILLCGHIVGLSCLFDHLVYRKSNGLPFACPFNVCGTSSHPECGFSYMGWPMPGELEHFGTSKRTTTEGLELQPKCFKCAFDDVVQSLTLLTGVLESKLFEDLKSFKVAYRIQIMNLVWGAFEGDERQSVEKEIPASMREHCRNIEASLINLYSCPSKVIGEGDLKIRFFEYSDPLKRFMVCRKLDTATDS